MPKHRSRRTRSNNPRFLTARPTTKPIPSLAFRRRQKKLQRKARQIQRRVKDG